MAKDEIKVGGYTCVKTPTLKSLKAKAGKAIGSILKRKKKTPKRKPKKH
jgi:hypothetical protein